MKNIPEGYEIVPPDSQEKLGEIPGARFWAEGSGLRHSFTSDETVAEHILHVGFGYGHTWAIVRPKTASLNDGPKEPWINPAVKLPECDDPEFEYRWAVRGEVMGEDVLYRSSMVWCRSHPDNAHKAPEETYEANPRLLAVKRRRDAIELPPIPTLEIPVGYEMVPSCSVALSENFPIIPLKNPTPHGPVRRAHWGKSVREAVGDDSAPYGETWCYVRKVAFELPPIPTLEIPAGYVMVSPDSDLPGTEVFYFSDRGRLYPRSFKKTVKEFLAEVGPKAWDGYGRAWCYLQKIDTMPAQEAHFSKPPEEQRYGGGYGGGATDAHVAAATGTFAKGLWDVVRHRCVHCIQVFPTADALDAHFCPSGTFTDEPHVPRAEREAEAIAEPGSLLLEKMIMERAVRDGGLLCRVARFYSEDDRESSPLFRYDADLTFPAGYAGERCERIRDKVQADKRLSVDTQHEDYV